MRIWIPNRKIIETRDPVGIVHRVAGFWFLEAMRPGRYVRPLTGWFPNLVTNSGLNLMGSGDSYLNVCRIGTGNSTPTTADTQLDNEVASTSSTWQSDSTGVASEAPHYGYRIKYFQFAAAGSALNISEIGIGPSTSLFSRALILDSNLAPTVISLQSGEILRAAYELRLYAPAADVVDEIDVEVDGTPVTTECTVRACEVDLASAWNFALQGIQAGVSSATANPPRVGVYAGGIGSVTDSPSGSASFPGSSDISNSAYVPDTFYRDGTISLPTSSGNVAGGHIRSIRIPFGAGLNPGFGAIQVEFDPPIPKDNERTAVFNIRHSWGRAS